MDALTHTAKRKRHYKSRNLENWQRWIAKGNNHQKHLANLKQWRLKNKEHVRQYRLKNRERLNESVKQWKLRNKQKVAEYRRIGRLRKQRMNVLKVIDELVSIRPSSRLAVITVA